MRGPISAILLACLAAITAPVAGPSAMELLEPEAPFGTVAETSSDRPREADPAPRFDLSFRSLHTQELTQALSPSGLARPGSGAKFASSFAMISGFEVSLLVGTMMLPKSFTGWEDDFFQDGMGNLAEAWTRPPVWDTDHWFHNYVGHPYGGNLYYNTLRARGGTVSQSFLFSAAMSTWWEYALEAVAERPSIQDLIVTPVAGSVLGEFTHRMASRMKRNGSGAMEKLFLAVLNPTDVIFRGYR